MLNLSRIKNQIDNHDADVAQLRVKFIKIIKVLFEDILKGYFRDTPTVDLVDWDTESGDAITVGEPLDLSPLKWYLPELEELRNKFEIKRIYATNYENQVIVQFFDTKGRRLP